MRNQADTPESLAKYNAYCVVCGQFIDDHDEWYLFLRNEIFRPSTMDEYGYIHHVDCIITDAIIQLIEGRGV
jgi:hypothetical protein